MNRGTESTTTKLIARVKHSADEEWTMGGSVASSAGTLHTEKTLASYVKVTDGVRKVQLRSSFTQSGFRPQIFSFSRCFSQETTQAAFFAECGAYNSINCLLDTCANLDTPNVDIGNFCVIAYGQTGAGKTHTMFGSSLSKSQPLNHSHIDAAVEENYETETQEEDPHSQPGDGLIVRSIEYLFMQLLHSVAAVPNFHLKLSCIEIYEDLVYDLFSGSNTLPVHLHEDATEGFSVQGCQLIDCTSFESAAAAIELIARHRRGRYAPNSRTSPLKDNQIHQSMHKVDRSHCIIEVSVCVPMSVGESGMSVYNSGLATPASQAALLQQNEYISDAVNSPRFLTRAKMTFVDLAGSERLHPEPKMDAKSTAGSTKSVKSLTANLFGTKEVGVINPSLYVLGRVIVGLVRAHNSIHTSEVPYQDSVLTKLLINPLARGNALGANILIACIDDSPRCEYETLRTLKFATSCVQLRNNPELPTPKASKEDKAISQLKMSIKKVKEDNQELRRTILSTPSWGDKILAHCDEDTLETSAAFANAPPRMKPKIKDVKKPVSLSEKKRTWADWKLFETGGAARSKTRKTSFLALPAHPPATTQLTSGCRVYPLAGPTLNGSPSHMSHTSQMSHSVSQSTVHSAHKVHKHATPHRGSSAPSPPRPHLNETATQESTTDAQEEMRLMELGDGLNHSRDSNDPHHATGAHKGQKTRPKSSPNEKTTFQMGAVTMSAFTDSEDEQHDPHRQLFSKTGPMPVRNKGTDKFEPVLEHAKKSGHPKTAKDQNHMAEVRMAAQMKKRVLDECRKKNHVPISPYLAHFVPKRVIHDRPTFEVPLLHDIVPLHASIHQDSPHQDSDGSHHSPERTAHTASHSGELKGHSQSQSPGYSNAVAKMNISGTLSNAHSPPRSRPHSRRGKRTQSGRRSPGSPGSAGRRSPDQGSAGKPRSPEVQALQKLIRTPTMMFELLDAEYQNYPYDEEMYANPSSLQERIPPSDKPHSAHGPPVIEVAEEEVFVPATALDLSVDGTSLSPAQKMVLKEEPQPDDEGEYEAYDEEFEAEESSVPVEEAPIAVTPVKVSPVDVNVASGVAAEFIPVTPSFRLDHPDGKTSPTASRASPVTVSSNYSASSKARDNPLFPIAGVSNAPAAPREPINLSMKMVAPAPSVPSPTQSIKMFSQPTSRAESPAATTRNWEAEAEALMAPLWAASQDRTEQENKSHFLDTFSPARVKSLSESEPHDPVPLRAESTGEEDYEGEFEDEEGSVKQSEAQPDNKQSVEPEGIAARFASDEIDPVVATESQVAESAEQTTSSKDVVRKGATTATVSDAPTAVASADQVASPDREEDDYGDEFEDEEEASAKKESTGNSGDGEGQTEQNEQARDDLGVEAPQVEADTASSELPAKRTSETDGASENAAPEISAEESDAVVDSTRPANDHNAEPSPAGDTEVETSPAQESEPVLAPEPIEPSPEEPSATSEPVLMSTDQLNENLNEKEVDGATAEPIEAIAPVAASKQNKETEYEEEYEMEFVEEEEDSGVAAAVPLVVATSAKDDVSTPTESNDQPAEAEPKMLAADDGVDSADNGERVVEPVSLVQQDTEAIADTNQMSAADEAASSNDVADQVLDGQADATSAEAADTTPETGAVSNMADSAGEREAAETLAEPLEVAAVDNNDADAASSELATSQVNDAAADKEEEKETEEENYEDEFEADDYEISEKKQEVVPVAHVESAEAANETPVADSKESGVLEEVASLREAVVEANPADALEQVPATEVSTGETNDNVNTDSAEMTIVEGVVEPTELPAVESEMEPTDISPMKLEETSPPSPFKVYSSKFSSDAVERAVSRLESVSPKPETFAAPLEIDLQDHELTLSPSRHSARENENIPPMSPLSPVRILGEIDPQHFISAATFNTNTTTSELFAHLQHEDVSELEELSAEYSPEPKMHGIAESELTNASAASLVALATPSQDAAEKTAAISNENVDLSDVEQVQEVSASPAAVSGSFPVGTRIEGNYRGKGRWYPGVVSDAHEDGSVDIDYDDGEKETNVAAALVRSTCAESSAADTDATDVAAETTEVETAAVPSFPVGTRIEGNYRGKGRWYAGAIARVRSEAGTVDIDYDDGEKETHVELDMVRRVGSAASDAAVSTPEGSEVAADSTVRFLPVGARVEGNYRGQGRWYPGVVSAVNAEGSVDIDYDDGEKETNVAATLVRLEGSTATQTATSEVVAADVASADETAVVGVSAAAIGFLSVGTRIEGNYRGSGHWYPGVVSAVNADGSVDLDYDDGEKETNVDATLVRPEGSVTTDQVAAEADAESARGVTDAGEASAINSLSVGARIEGNYRDKGRWYPGIIAQVNADGSFDIDYDDGEKETNVTAELVRLVSSAAAEAVTVDAAAGADAETVSGEPAAAETTDVTSFPVGTRVEGNYRASGHWYPGVVSVVNTDGSFNIDYDDGEKETNVAAALIRAEESAPSESAAVASTANLGGTASDSAGVANIAEADIASSLSVGTRVEGNYRGSGHWYPGVVSAVNDVGSVDIDYDDGEKETNVASALVRPDGSVAADAEVISADEFTTVQAPPAGSLPVGARVEGNYRGLGTWYPGTVAQVNADGSVDLDYDDGEKETNVAPSSVRLEASTSRELAAAGLEAKAIDFLPAVSASDDANASTEATVVGSLIVGARIEGNYRGLNTWYPGTIAQVNADGSVDIDFDDGEKETNVAASLIRIASSAAADAAVIGDADVADSDPAEVAADTTISTLSVGARVEGNYRASGIWYPGVVSAVNDDGSFDIDYDDGEKEAHVTAELVRLEGSAPCESVAVEPEGVDPMDVPGVAASEATVAVTEADISSFSVGTRVDGNYRGLGIWYPGTIAQVNADGSVDIDYDDGEKETNVGASLVRLEGSAATDSAVPVLDEVANAAAAGADTSTLNVGTRVEGNYRGLGTWYPGVVAAVNTDGSVDIDYDDGEKETNVDASLFRLEASAAAESVVVVDAEVISADKSTPVANFFHVGARVQADYRGLGTWYPGTISQVNADGSVDVDYDDGEKETNVAPSSVRPEVSAEVTTADGEVPVSDSALQPEAETMAPFVKVGSRVRGNYHGSGEWRAGEVLLVDANGRADLMYDNGEIEGFVPVERLQLAEGDVEPAAEDTEEAAEDDFTSSLPVGTRVEADYRGLGTWYPGTVAQVNADGSLDIDYDDGEKETNVTAVLVRPEGSTIVDAGPAERGPTTDSDGPVFDSALQPEAEQMAPFLKVGSRVRGNYHGSGEWRAGEVLLVDANGRADLMYDNGEIEGFVPVERLQLAEGDIEPAAEDAGYAEEVAMDAVEAEGSAQQGVAGVDEGAAAEFAFDENYPAERDTGALNASEGYNADYVQDPAVVDDAILYAQAEEVAPVDGYDEVATQEAVPAVDTEAQYESNELTSTQEGVDQLNASGAEEEEKEFVPNFDDFWKELPSKSGEAPATVESAAPEPEFVMSGDAQERVMSGEEDEEKEFVPNFDDFWKELPSKSGEAPVASTESAAAPEPEFVASGDLQERVFSGEDVPSFKNFWAEVPAASGEEPVLETASGAIETSNEAQDEPLGHPEEDPSAVVVGREFGEEGEFVPSFKNFWSEDLAEGEVPASVEAEAEASEEPTLAEAQAEVEVSGVSDSVEVEAEAPELPASVEEEGEASEVPVPNEVKEGVPVLQEAISNESAEVAVEAAVSGEIEVDASVEKETEAPAVVNAPAAEPVLNESEVEVPTETEAVADENATEMTQEVEEPAMEDAATSAKVKEAADITADPEPEKNMPADDTEVEAPVVERSTAPDPSVGEAENAAVSDPPAKPESQPNETEPNAPAEEQPTPSPVSVEDVPENNTNTVTITESKKLDNAPSESMFDVDFSELASAKESPLNNTGDKNIDNNMDSATLAALALSAESTDEQDNEKETPTIVADNTVQEKSAKEAKSIKSTKSGKSAGNGEEEEDIYDVDF